MKRPWTIPAIHALAIFLGSFLLFLIQPIQGKFLLPLLGGAPFIWNTCMVFFQAALLLGYLYAHLITSRLGIRKQIIAHSIILLLPLLLLPPTLTAAVMENSWLTSAPLLWLVLALSTSTGLVFFAVSTTSPLLQSWFTQSKTDPSNPYVLYAASNAGSLCALILYPFAIEPRFGLDHQLRLWSYGYLLLVLFIFIAATILWRLGSQVNQVAKDTPSSAEELNATLEGSAPNQISDDSDNPDYWLAASDSKAKSVWLDRFKWSILAFAPSSLMLGVTTFMSTDVASIPLLWLLPLTLYMLSFVIVFTSYTEKVHRRLCQLLPWAIAIVLFLMFTDFRSNLWLIALLHLTCFFLIALTCHGKLVLLKPQPSRLTEFYFFLSLGGVLGGSLNAIVAPNIFTTIAEYPLVLAISLYLVLEQRSLKSSHEMIRNIITFAAFAGIMWASLELYDRGFLDDILWLEPTFEIEWSIFHLNYNIIKTTLVYALPLIIAATAFRSSRQLGVAMLGFIIVDLALGDDATLLHRERSIYGVLTVRKYDAPLAHTLIHGGTIHGEQRRGSAEERLEPLSYYHRQGPLGQIMEAVHQKIEEPKIAAIGLGSGSIAAYGTPKNNLVFFELDPYVEKLARNPDFFTYVDDCIKRWCQLSIEIGDGRLGIQHSRDTFDLIIVDAFSSDAIPIHLLTVEAMQTYLAKLNPGGILAFHISNRYIDLEPVLYNLSDKLSLGYALRSDEGNDASGENGSSWAIIARDEGIFNTIVVDDERWRGLISKDGVGLWTDNYANVISVYTWL